MTEPLPKGKHSVRPSQLRNEIRPEPSDDGIGIEEPSIQQSCSEVIVPETQLDCESDFGFDDSLDVEDEAIIQRNAVSKTTKAILPSPFKIDLLSKASFGPQEIHANPPSASFSFTRVMKGPGKPPPEDQVVSQQPIAQVNTTSICIEESKDLAGNSNITTAANTEARSPPILPDHDEHNTSNLIVPPLAQEHSTPISVGISHQQPNEISAKSTRSDVDETLVDHKRKSRSSEPSLQTPVLVSARSKPYNGTEQVRVFKKGKTGKKILLRQRTRPRPPAIAHDTNQIARTAVSLHAGTNMPIDPQASFLSGQPDFDKADYLGIDTNTPSEPDQSHHDMRNDTAQESQAINNQRSQDMIDDVNVIQSVPQGTNQSRVSPSPYNQPMKEDSVPEAFSEHHHIIDSKRPLHGTGQALPSELSQAPHLQSTQAMSSTVATIDPRQLCNNAMSSASNSENRSLYPGQVLIRASKLTSSNDEVDMMSSQPHGQIHSDQVENDTQEPCTLSGPLIRHVQESAIPTNIELSFGNLRDAVIAGHLQVKHEHEMNAKHHQELVVALQETLALQNTSLAEWKAKHKDLRASVIQLAEKAKTNQKYVTGLQKDHEKLQKSVKLFQEQNKKTLREKMDEVEREKYVLREEVGKTLDVLSRSQKKLNATIAEFHTQLLICESEKKNLAGHLSTQKTLYEDERRRRLDLENNLVCAVQTLQREFINESTTFKGFFNELQSSFLAVDTEKHHNPEVTQCLMILQNLQNTPFLTTKDVCKSEGMLRFTHKSIESGLENLNRTLENKHSTTNQIQTFIATQMNDLRAHVVKYNETVLENGRLYDFYNPLNGQLKTRSTHSPYLDGERLHQPRNIDQTAHSSSLVRALNKSDQVWRDHEETSMEWRKQLSDIHQQLKETNDQLTVARAEIDQKEQHHQQLTKEVAKQQSMYLACRAKLLELGREEQQRKTVEAGSWNKLVKQFQKYLSTKESAFKNDIHRLAVARDEMGVKFQDEQKQATAAKNKMHDLNGSVKTLTTKLELVRAHKDAIGLELNTAKQEALENRKYKVEATDLRAQLKRLTEELQSTKQSVKVLEDQHIEASNDSKNLRSSYEQFRDQIDEQNSTIVDLRKELKECQTMKEELLEKLESLRSELEKTGATETKLYNVKETLSMKEDTLRALQEEIEAQKTENARIQECFASEKQKQDDRHCAEMNKLTEYCTQLEAALHESRPTSCKERSKENLNEQRLTPLLTHSKEHSRPLKDAHVGNETQWIYGHEHSTSSKVRPNNRWHDNATSLSDNIHLNTAHIQNDDEDLSLHFSEAGYGEDYSPTVMDPVTEPVPETQENTFPSMSHGNAQGEFTQETQCVRETQISASTDLSSIGSDELTHMETGVHRSFTPVRLGHSQELPVNKSDAMHTGKSPLRPERVPMPVSQDRPRSQANTASRLMPHLGLHSHHFNHGSQDHDDSTSVITGHAMNADGHQTLGSGRNSNTGSNCSISSSLGFMHNSSTLKLTYNNGSKQDERDIDTLEDLEQDHAGKRKRSVGQSGRKAARKKQRTYFHPTSNTTGRDMTQITSTSYESSKENSPPEITFDSSHVHHAAPGSSRSHSQNQPSNNRPHRHSQVSSPNRQHGYHKHDVLSSQSQGARNGEDVSSRLTRSKSRRSNESYDARFSQELGPR